MRPHVGPAQHRPQQLHQRLHVGHDGLAGHVLHKGVQGVDQALRVVLGGGAAVEGLQQGREDLRFFGGGRGGARGGRFWMPVCFARGRAGEQGGQEDLGANTELVKLIHQVPPTNTQTNHTHPTPTPPNLPAHTHLRMVLHHLWLHILRHLPDPKRRRAAHVLPRVPQQRQQQRQRLWQALAQGVRASLRHDGEGERGGVALVGVGGLGGGAVGVRGGAGGWLG